MRTSWAKRKESPGSPSNGSYIPSRAVWRSSSRATGRVWMTIRLRRSRSVISSSGAWLLNRLSDVGGGDEHRELAKRLLDWGVRHGWDARRGGVVDQCDRRGRVMRDSRTFWVQSEALRAMLYAWRRGGGLVEPEVLATTSEFVWRHCADHEHGGWFSCVDSGGEPISSDKGGVWKLDYHIVSLCDEAMRLLGSDGA